MLSCTIPVQNPGIRTEWERATATQHKKENHEENTQGTKKQEKLH